MVKVLFERPTSVMILRVPWNGSPRGKSERLLHEKIMSATVKKRPKYAVYYQNLAPEHFIIKTAKYDNGFFGAHII